MDFRGEMQKWTNNNKLSNDEQLKKFAFEVIAQNQKQLPILYRYSRADYYAIRSLETCTLHLTEIGKMNDPFEGISAKAEGTVDERVLRIISDVAYIKSFSENENDLFMWGQYADNFAGMCLAYDFSEDEAADYEAVYHLFPVVYSKKRFGEYSPEKLGQALMQYKECERKQQKSKIEIPVLPFLTKSKDWEKEREWRLVVTYPHLTKPNDSERAVNGENLPQNTVMPLPRKVYLGPRMPIDVQRHIIEICDKLNQENKGKQVYWYKMQLDKDEYKLIVQESNDPTEIKEEK